MTRRLLTGAAIAVALLSLSAPAWAHEEINPSTVPTGKPIFLTLSAANERDADLVKITLTAPDGAPFGETTRQPSGWTVQHSEKTVTWSGGAVEHESFESWGFEVEGVDQPGTLTYKVTLGFADGTSESAEVVVTASAEGVTTATTAAGGSATVTAEPATTLPADRAAASETDDDDEGVATAALVVGIIAGVVAIAALITALRRPAAPTATPTSSPNESW
jgi:hypothetical protein